MFVPPCDLNSLCIKFNTATGEHASQIKCCVMVDHVSWISDV